jgi:hypothetical protein
VETEIRMTRPRQLCQNQGRGIAGPEQEEETGPGHRGAVSKGTTSKNKRLCWLCLD